MAVNRDQGASDKTMTHLAKASTNAASAVTAIVPTIPYRDAGAMIDWLSDAYGFEKQRVVKSEHGDFLHAQLIFGDSIIIVVRAEDSKLQRLIVHPDQIGGVETQACYVVLPDIDAHYARATAKGAEIVSGIEGKDRGDRSYVSRDPEGHIWMFGTYDPYQARHRNHNAINAAAMTINAAQRKGFRAPLLALAVTLLIVLIAVGVMWTHADSLAALKADALRLATEERSAPQGAKGDAKRLADELLQVQAAKESTERKLSQTLAALETAVKREKEVRRLLVQETRAKEGLARTVAHSGDMLARERIAREAAEKIAREATEKLSRTPITKPTAELAAKEMIEKYERERKSRALAEQSLQNAIAELARERSAKAAAEIAASELRNQLTALGAMPPEIPALRDQMLAERRAREKLEQAAKDAKLLLTQEKYSRDATERELKQAQDQLKKAEDRLAVASCWVCPSGAPCARP
jgi:uncharacterized glyoxalase superfamily protein PhnB